MVNLGRFLLSHVATLLSLAGLLGAWLPCFNTMAQVAAPSKKSAGLANSGPVDTLPLTGDVDLASEMVAGIDRFALQQIAINKDERAKRFDAAVDRGSPKGLSDSLIPLRDKLAHMVGVRDQRLTFQMPEMIPWDDGESLLAQSATFTVQTIRWPVLGDPSPQLEDLPSLWGDGLLLLPTGDIVASVVVLPDADQSPELVCGLTPGLPVPLQIACQLAQAGCRVVVPALVSRGMEKRLGGAELTHREYLHRAAFELGRTLAGYEVQTTLAMVDWFLHTHPDGPVGIYGYGEGGLLALLAGALDPRIQVTCVSGFWGPRENCWAEPIDRNFFGMLRDFGAAELALLVAPRSLILHTAPVPVVRLPGRGGAPAEIVNPDRQDVQRLVTRVRDRGPQGAWLLESPQNPASDICDRLFGGDVGDIALARPQSPSVLATKELAAWRVRQERRRVKEIDRHNQALLRESSFVRQQFMSQLDVGSLDAYRKSLDHYRKIFRDEVIGQFDQPLLPFNARSRQSWETESWTGHEVVLDVFPDVFTYGVLLLPKDLAVGEQRPVVVCQHGLEGRPTDVFLGNHRAYHDFAAKLCERGFIIFCPQNPYIFADRFRTLQRKLQPLGKTLFSVIVPQHQQLVDWLKSQPFVDGDRVAFYGLSYGGKAAMRIPPLVTDYCLSICSGDFNEWVLKNASSRDSFSYIRTGEYEIFEWDLGSTFNYAEMAALICPRPFMVERGHFDGVAKDEWVAFEYAKVRRLYAAKLGIGERTEIEWFAGPHTINGEGTFRFLHRHLDWPKPDAQ